MGAIEAPWRIELFGGLRAIRDDRTVTRFRTRKTVLLLAYLAYHPRQSHPREALFELLWPGCEPARGRNNLSKELTALRHLLEPGTLWAGVPAGAILFADRASVRLNPAAITTDVAQFEEALHAAARTRSAAERRQRLAEAVDLYRGELLAGCFEEWVLQERLRLAEAYFEALGQLVAAFEQAGDLQGAVDLARRGVSLDPLREELCRDLMRLLAIRDQPEAALRHYSQLERLLEQDLGAEPEDETRALARDLARRVPPVPDPPGGEKLLVRPEEGAAPVRWPSLQASLLPTGTMTFFLAEITEVVAQPELVQAGSPTAAASCWELLTPVLRGYGGHPAGAAGGMLPFLFGRASDALAAALAGMAVLRQPPHFAAWVRLALHTGELEPGATVPQSPALAHTTRLLLAAHPGQILLTEATAALLARDRAGAPPVTDLGRYRLSPGMEPERLFQANEPGAVRRSFPPPNALPAPLGSLPLSLTRFFGREEETARLHGLLHCPDTRLVTLTGPGGSGKTRLALEVARSIDPSLWSAVSFVPLVDLADPERIPERVLAALHIPRSPETPALDQVVAVLSSSRIIGSGRTLLVLDNFEHLLADGADVVQSLLEQLPSLTCLLTSRCSLSLEAEQEVRVGPLPVPVGRDNPADLIRCAAVQLFVDRAQAVRPDFQLTATNAAAVAAMCRYLEGIPLAIVLAAARAQVLTPGQMLAQMGHRFDLLVSRRRGTHWRHQSLRATLDWSFQLLSLPVQRLLARLSVFRGGWTLEAAEQVCLDSGLPASSKITEDPPPLSDPIQNPKSKTQNPGVLDLLAQLCDGSLVQVEESAGEMRFQMLETVREYARQQLAEEEAAALRRRHAEYYLALAERAEPELEGAEQALWFARLERERDNLRAALSWAEENESSGAHGKPSEPDDGRVGLRLAGALGLFWEVRGPVTEGRRWLEEALARNGGGSNTARAARAKALAAAGKLAWGHGDPEAVRALCEESVAIARELADRRQLVRSLFTLGWVSVYPGDLAAAMGYQRECHALAQELGDRSSLALALLLRVRVAFSDDPGREHFDLETCLAIFRELGNKRMIAMVAGELAGLALWRGDDEQAWAYQEEALANHQELGDPRNIARGLLGLGRIAVSRAELGAAYSYYQEGLAVVQRLVDRWHAANLLTGLGVVNGLQGNYEAARQCHGEALALKRDHRARLDSAVNLHFLGEVAMAQGRWTEARALFEEADAIDREHSIRGGLAAGARGRAAVKLGEFDEARRIFEADLANKRELGDRRAVATNLHDLGGLCVHEGRHQAACSFAKESLVIRKELRDRLGMIASLELLAAAAAVRGQARLAAILFGAAAALREEIGAPLPPAERADYERRQQLVRAALGEAAFAGAWAEGRVMSLDRAVQIALEAPTTSDRRV